MKKLLLAITLVGISLPSHAYNYSYCVAVAQLAQATMSGYQAGVPYEASLNASDLPLAQQITKDAFSRHRFTIESFRYQSSLDFSMEYYAKCLDSDL